MQPLGATCTDRKRRRGFSIRRRWVALIFLLAVVYVSSTSFSSLQAAGPPEKKGQVHDFSPRLKSAKPNTPVAGVQLRGENPPGRPPRTKPSRTFGTVLPVAPVVRQSLKYSLSPALRSLKPAESLTRAPRQPVPARVIPLGRHPKAAAAKAGVPSLDPALQLDVILQRVPQPNILSTPTESFEGISNTDNGTHQHDNAHYKKFADGLNHISFPKLTFPR